MEYLKPNALERGINKAFGFLVRLGFGSRDNYLLEVTGRKSGRKYSTPINLLQSGGKRYLVATRGYTQWVRNVEVTGEATLSKGSHRESVSLTPVNDDLKPQIIKEYLDTYAFVVQRFFPVKAGSPVETFVPLAPNYPVFEVRALPVKGS